MTVLYLCSAILVMCILYCLKIRKAWRMTRSIPSPLPILPFFGHALMYINPSVDIFQALNKRWNEYGTRFRFLNCSQLVIALADPKDTEIRAKPSISEEIDCPWLTAKDYYTKVWVSQSLAFGLGSTCDNLFFVAEKIIFKNNYCDDKAEEYECFRPWLGEGLLTSNGKKWKKHRKAISPSFNFKILLNFVNVFNDQSDIMVEKLRSYAINQETFDVFPLYDVFSLDVICETAMGVSINAQKDSESEYARNVKSQCQIIKNRIKNPLMQIDFLFKLTDDYRKQKKTLAFLHDFTDRIIRERRQILLSTQRSFNSYADGSESKEKIAFLDHLLVSKIDGELMSDICIRDEVNTLLFGGHDTVPTTTSFLLYLLSNNPEVQAKVYEEQVALFGNDKSRSPTYSELQNNMNYLEMVIKESLRLYPPVPILGRKVKKDVQMNDVQIPAETTIVFLVYNNNRNPDVFPDPDKFIPERFLPEECNKRSAYSSISFGAGSRICLGIKFAMLEMKANLSKVIRQFEIIPSGIELQLAAYIVLMSKTGINIKVRARD